MIPMRFRRIPQLLGLLTVLSHPLSVAAQSTLREHIDVARLRVARDSFVVILQGKPKGWQRLTTARDGKGWVFGDAVSVDSFVTQSSTISFDAQLEEQSLRQDGMMMGRAMQISLDWQSGRVRGRSMTPSSGPAGAIAIDTSVTLGTIDDNAVMPQLSAVRFREGFAVEFLVLASGKGTIALQHLRVVGSEPVTVPAGQFDTWRVELRAERSATFVNVTKSAPYRIVRISNGPAFEMLLVK
jgi:hypothetical protein